MRNTIYGEKRKAFCENSSQNALFTRNTKMLQVLPKSLKMCKIAIKVERSGALVVKSGGGERNVHGRI